MAQQQDRARTVSDEWVELKHKDVASTFRAHPRAVAHWEKRGWTPVDTKAAAAAKKEN